MAQPARSAIARYGFAVVSVVLMTGLRLVMPISPRHRFVTFFFAIVFTAWYGGLGPSVLAVALACLSVAYFFMPPYFRLAIKDPDDLVGIGMFIAVCTAIIAFSEAGRAARRKLEQEIADRRRAEQSEREQRERLQTTLSERKRAEQALQESEEQYRAVYSQAATGIGEADLSGRIVRANDRFCEIAGYPRDELLGMRFGDITYPDDRAESVDPFERLIEGGPCYTIEKRYLRKDGSTVWARVAVSMIRDSSGRPARIAAVIEEISERKRLEGELRRRVEELAEADRRKDEFLATLAHELRNPLAPIRNALRLMASPTGDDGEIETERAMAERQVVHLARLIDDLMDVARISRGKIELRREGVELAPVIRRALESVRSSLRNHRHELTVTMPDEPIHLEADPTRLEQVFWNLLNNAIKYTEPGGSIGISVTREGSEVTIRVRDTGVGIDPLMLPKIFGMFVQAGDSTERSQGGLGIGLSLVKNLVELHGGSVRVESDGPGKGTEFVVRLPVLPDLPRRRGETKWADPPRSHPNPPRRRILVVDDNVDAATSLAKLLSRLHGQEVRVAHDGPGAIRVADEFSPELVLLDIGMPGMDGYEVARHLRARPEFEGVLLVALTGWGQQSDRERSRMAGFDHHLIKPVDPDALVGLLAETSPSTLGHLKHV